MLIEYRPVLPLGFPTRCQSAWVTVLDQLPTSWAGTLALEPAAAGPAATTAKVAGATEREPRGDATPPGNVASTAQRGSIRCGTQVPASSGVFGTTDARPLNRKYSGDPTQGDGMDVSPALNGCLGFNDPDGDNDHVNWQFVDAPQVSAGPLDNPRHELRHRRIANSLPATDQAKPAFSVKTNSLVSLGGGD